MTPCKWALRWILASALLTSCSSGTRDSRQGEQVNRSLPWSAPSEPGAAPATSSAARIEDRWLTYEPPGEQHGRTLNWTPVHPPRLQLASTDAVSTPETAAANSAGKESLFSKDYWKLLGQDVKEVFTAPVRWDTSDWLVFSAVTAGIVTVGVFDEDIQKAVQRNRTRTTDDIFKAVQPFGAEYSAAVLGGFYLGGEIFSDRKARAVALDGLSASIIASGLVD